MDADELARLGHLNFLEILREAARWTQDGVIHEADGMLCVAGERDFPVMVNGAARTDDRADADVCIKRAGEFFAARNRGFTVFVRDTGADDDLRAAAESAGLKDLFSSPEMICPERLGDRPPPAGAELRRVVDAKGVADLAEVNAQAFTVYGMPADVVRDGFTRPLAVLQPHIAAFVAYVDGEPVSAAMTCVSHGIAGVYWVGTVEAARGKGIGEACTRAATNAGFDLGGRAQSLQASRMGEPIYRRMGYETSYRYHHLVKGA
jgi:ribosomal protein S18 acetylase RimI-like enzyme